MYEAAVLGGSRQCLGTADVIANDEGERDGVDGQVTAPGEILAETKKTQPTNQSINHSLNQSIKHQKPMVIRGRHGEQATVRTCRVPVKNA